MNAIKLPNDDRWELPLGLAAVLLALGVYVATSCPTLNFIDSGELAAVCSTLGISHPTGYPLFTLAGWLFAKLPLGMRVITKLNLMAAIFVALALVMYFRSFVYLLGLQRDTTASGKRFPSRRMYAVTLPALFAMLLLAFSPTYWSQGLAIEVYSLHLLLIAIVLFFFIRAIFQSGKGEERGGGGRPGTDLFAFAFALGLSFSNHMTTIFLAPAFLYMYFATFGWGRASWRSIAWMVPAFLVGLSVYAYLPLRAAEHPLLNWGDPVTVDAFLRHTSAKQYSVWLFSSAETAKRQFGHFLSGLPGEFAYGGIVVAAAGLWTLFREHRKLFVFTLLLFVGCVGYAINYDIHDIESYFLLAYVTVAIWAAFGARAIMGAVTGERGRAVAAVALIGFTFVEGALHAPKVTLRDMTLVEEYTTDMFRSLEPNAFVLSYQWDYFVSASYYLQHVEGVRTDVVIVDKELLRRSWYYGQLERQYPWLIANSRAEVNAFLVELRKFEHDLPYNPQVIEARFAAVIRSFMARSAAERPVYVTPEIEPQYTLGLKRIPAGLAERILAEVPSAPLAEPRFEFRVPERRDSYVDGIVGLYAQAYARAATYEASLGRTEHALLLIAKALETSPGLPGAVLFQEQLKKQVNGGG